MLEHRPEINERRSAMKEQPTNLRRYFTHYRSGKKYDAYDYGHKAWPIGASAADRKQNK